MKGIVRVSKLKFVLVALDVNPAAIMFVVVTVFETTRFASGCVNAEAVTFVRLFPEPKRRPETFRVATFALPAIRVVRLDVVETFRVVE